jgi:hypothetical protein
MMDPEPESDYLRAQEKQSQEAVELQLELLLEVEETKSQ